MAPLPPIALSAPGLYNCTVAPETPKGLAAIIDSLLAVERSERPPSAEWTAIRLEQVNRELAGLSRKVPPESVGPFRGLGRFEAGDRDVYFGRASEVAAALEVLRGRGVTALVFVGLATDFCVAFSALDAAKLGFQAAVLEDACRAIDLNGSLAEARRQMQAAGVALEA